MRQDLSLRAGAGFPAEAPLWASLQRRPSNWDNSCFRLDRTSRFTREPPMYSERMLLSSWFQAHPPGALEA